MEEGELRKDQTEEDVNDEDDVEVSVSTSGGKLQWQNSFYENFEDSIRIDETLRLHHNEKQTRKETVGTLEEEKPVAVDQKFGTLVGVFLPCLQNILGVILFLRLPWIVGQAGVILAIVVVFICVASTFLTTLSLSALATNGKIRAGGPYAIVLDSMGAEIGGSIGVLFYLGTTIAATMYSLGGVEAIYVSLLKRDEELFPFDRQVFAIAWTATQGSIVYAGMKYVARVASLFLVAVLIAILLMFLGGILFAAGVWNPEGVERVASASENLHQSFQTDPTTGITPDFVFMIALFYPSVTGIMAGTNRSAVLATPGKSIPKGTLGAIMTTTGLYLVTILLFGLVVANDTLKTNKLVGASIAWPSEYIVAAGIILSTYGAGLQSLTGAPQLLRSIANDGHIPFLRVFGTASPEQEPRRAVLFTTALSALVCLAGNLDYITPIITMFFLSMYGSINAACFIFSVYRSPNFRPTWKYFHWSTALLGMTLCVVLMFVISVLYAFVALLLISSIYFYIRHTREKKEWGDALFGLRLDQAKNALLDLSAIHTQRKYKQLRRRKRRQLKKKKTTGKGSTDKGFSSFSPDGSQEKESTKRKNNCLTWFLTLITCGLWRVEGEAEKTDSEAGSGRFDDYDDEDIDELEAFDEQSGGTMTQRDWRPQILVLCKLQERPDKKGGFRPTQPELLELTSQLKKGRGLTLVHTVLHGDVLDVESKKKCAKARRLLCHLAQVHDIKGFTDVLLSSNPDLLEPFRVLFQSKGLGMLCPNTIMCGWPKKWRGLEQEAVSPEGVPVRKNLLKSKHQEAFVSMLKSAIGCQKAIIVVKSQSRFPKEENESRFIDVWWLLHDGDMLVLLPYLLQRHKVWAGAKLRIFAIADDLVDFTASHAVLSRHLQELRISAVIQMVHVGASHARDVDQNRTIMVKSTSQQAEQQQPQNSILSSDMFQPLASTDGQPTDVNVADVVAASPAKGSKLVKKLSRRRSGSGDKSLQLTEFHDSKVDPKRVEEIAQFIKDSSGQDTQKWISQKYAQKPGGEALTSLFSGMEGITEGEEGEEVDDEESNPTLNLTSNFTKPETIVTQSNNTHQTSALVGLPSVPESTAVSPAAPPIQVPTVESHDLESGFDERTSASCRLRHKVVAQREKDGARFKKRLVTATYLNQKIREHSLGADLVVLNLPLSRVTPTAEFIAYTEKLTEGLHRVIMLRGYGTENVATLG